MLQIAGTVTNDGPTPYTIYFNPERLDKVKAKYAAKGAILKIGKATPMEPAAISLATVSFFKSENNKHDKIGKSVRSTSTKDPRGGRHESRLKAVLCTTTNRRFACVTDAALEYGLQPAAVSNHLNHPDKHKQVKGYRFLWANPADVKQSVHA